MDYKYIHRVRREKQVNELVSKAINKLYELSESNLNEFYSIDDVILNNTNINRLEGFLCG